MTPRSGTAWRKAWPRASSPTSTGTVARWARRRLRGEGLALLLLIAALAGASACAYLNTFYNAEQAYREGVRLRAVAGDSLTAPSRAAFERAAQKGAVVLDRHPDSAYVDDALLLIGQSFFELGRHSDASAAFRSLLDRYPDSELAPEARLGLVRSERLSGDYVAARSALDRLVAEPGDVDPAEVLYESGLIHLGTGEHAAALESLRALLSDHPGFALERRVALRFADAELAAGQFDAAVEAYDAYRSASPDPNQDQAITLRVAHALSHAGRDEEAISAYADLLAGSLADTLRARVHTQRGELHLAGERWDDAEADFRRAAELAPGTAAASRATLGRARIEWRERGRREPALEILLDAYLHAPSSVWGDSASRDARALARILHYERISNGTEVVAGLDDPTLVRSTALYRLAEEIRDIEGDRAGAIAVFDRLLELYPESPWAPVALMASGLLARETGAAADAEARLARLVSTHPDHPAADSARRILGLPVPDRPPRFYDDPATLVALAEALPSPNDPLITIADQMGRYVAREDRIIRPAGSPGAAGIPTGQTQPPPQEVPPDRELPPGVTP